MFWDVTINMRVVSGTVSENCDRTLFELTPSRSVSSDFLPFRIFWADLSCDFSQDMSANNP